MERSCRNPRLVGVAAGAIAVAAVAALARWDRAWQAGADDAVAPLPGDDELADPKTVITRTIDIDARAEDVWPWLVQLGADRGGFYSYDWLEDLFGLDIHNADTIVARWQHREVGDLVPADRRARGGWYVVALEPADTLAMILADVPNGRPARRDGRGRFEFLWTFHLRRLTDDRTRLVVREAAAFGSEWSRRLMSPVRFVSFVMTRKMLLGIKQRAEGRRQR